MARTPRNLTRLITPPAVYWNRRAVLRAMGVAGLAAVMGSPGCGEAPAPTLSAPETFPKLRPFPAARNARYAVDRPLTPEAVAATYNNFYEFSEAKEEVARLVAAFRMHPWRLQVAGLVDRPRSFDLDEILALPQEERVYRFRCVEAWSMVVPWTGFPLARLLDLCRPLATAKFVRFTSFLNPLEAPNQKTGKYAWPYHEALSIAEARHELTLLSTGIYGQPLKKQHGGPLRIVVPWKYGYKSPKSIVKIELTTERPKTFWNELQPLEYSFESNVEPLVPHPRWSQESERVIGTGERIPSLRFNGYGEQVAGLYRG